MDLEKGSSHKYIVTSQSPPNDVTKSCAQRGSHVKSAVQIAVFVSLMAFVAVFSWYLYTEGEEDSPEFTSNNVLGQDNASTHVYSSDTEEPTTFNEPKVTTPQTDIISDSWPFTFGGNIGLNTQHPKGYRKGEASDSHSCDNIRSVPEELRSAGVMYKYGIPEFYQKYTEAYGIPVLGSVNVTDVGLKRACYILRLLLASRYDIRNALYKFYIRVALIGDDEETTSLWEYRDWDSDYWDKRTRGIGPTLLYPLVSAGDDNQRCRTGSRYSYMDVLLHELSHGVHHFGARYIIPGFELQLKGLYDNAMSAQMYKNSYAATNKDEYWAVGTEIYFGSHKGSGYKYNINGTVVALRDKETLAMYDPGLVDLLEEVFPCQNVYYSRCAHKECSLANFQLLSNDIFGNLSSECDHDQTYSDITDPSLCAQKACSTDTNVFWYKTNNTCSVYHCNNVTNLGSRDVEGDIYIAIDRPGIGELESSMDLHQLCTKPANMTDRCTVATANRKQCGPPVETKEQCEARGCCDLQGQCVYSQTSACVDRLLTCHTSAIDGLCETNTDQMTSQCPNSCNTGVCQIEGV